MKLQDAPLKAMAKKITWWQAADNIGVSDRTMRRRREPGPLPGMLLHIGGGKHQWFYGDRWYGLIVILDDAAKEIDSAQLVEEESTRTVMAALRAVIEARGGVRAATGTRRKWDLAAMRMEARTPRGPSSLARPGARTADGPAA